MLLLVRSLPEPSHQLQYVQTVNHRGIPLWLVVYTPKPAVYSRAPGAVICQPFNNPPEYARLLALELVRDGFAVVTFDWRGRSPGENRQRMGAGLSDVLRADVAAAVACLRGLPGIDPERIVLAGHSVGGTLAIEAAVADPRITGVASIGMEADVTPQQPRNLLWTVGLYDEFRVLNHMREVFQASAATAALENTTVGDIPRGTARRLGISPTADHFTELQDWRIHSEVRRWFRQSVGLPASSKALWAETRALVVLLAWLLALLGAIWGLRRAAASRAWLLRASGAVALVGVVLLSRIHGHHFLALTDAILWLLVFAVLFGFVSTRGEDSLQEGWRFALRVGLVLWASVMLTLTVNNLASYVHEPRYLLYLPEFVFRQPLDALYAYLLVYSRPLFYSTYNPEAVSPRLWVYAVVAIEVLSPGVLLGIAARLARGRARVKARGRFPQVSLVVLLLVVLVVLAVVVWLRLQQGFLTGESARAALRFLLRFTALPVLVFWVLWRWSQRIASLKAGRGVATGEQLPTGENSV